MNREQQVTAAERMGASIASEGVLARFSVENQPAEVQTRVAQFAVRRLKVSIPFDLLQQAPLDHPSNDNNDMPPSNENATSDHEQARSDSAER